MNDEKISYFLKRTNAHIQRVQDNAEVVVRNFPELEELSMRIKIHDESKFKEPEREPYIELSWNYKIGRPEKNREDWILKATEHHVKCNKHHPEYWDNSNLNTINPINRDEPLRLIDGSKMDDISIAEMVCDWQSMSQEYNEKSCRKWADDNINVRWQFTDDQVELIYKIIETFEDANL